MAETSEEVAVLVQRVVKDITNAFRRNPHIDEIGLIPCPEARYNRSPIVLVENKLGVESWCVKFLLPYVHNKLILYRTRKQWLNKDELIDVTCTLLLLNPDFTTAWNIRKELILSGTLNPIKDLHLGKLALTKFPKSPETWIHRRWVLQQLIQETSLPSFVTKGNLGTIPAERTHRLIQEEMEVCGEAAGRYSSNYNAWSHRIWVLQHLAKLDVKPEIPTSEIGEFSLRGDFNSTILEEQPFPFSSYGFMFQEERTPDEVERAKTELMTWVQILSLLVIWGK
ncbi:protein prenyltransferase alpha subunit repeat-containing protein 1 isoform 2-T2 [Rhynchonycteris naso]